MYCDADGAFDRCPGFEELVTSSDNILNDSWLTDLVILTSHVALNSTVRQETPLNSYVNWKARPTPTTLQACPECPSASKGTEMTKEILPKRS